MTTQEITDYFESKKPLPNNILVSPGVTVMDAELFVSTQLIRMNHRPGSLLASISLDHLLQYKTAIENQKV